MNTLASLKVETSTSEVSGMWPVLDARSKIFDQQCTVRAYVPNVLVSSKGWVKFDVIGMKKRHEVGRPFHFLLNDVLYAFKINKMRGFDSFGMNHEMFASDMYWKSSVILHFIDDEPFVFTISREEWMETGLLPQRQNQELQVFIEMPDFRRLPISMIPKGGFPWLQECFRIHGRRSAL